MSNEARKDEAAGKDATVEFRGHTFVVPRNYDDWSVDFLESIEEGKSVGIVRGALGLEQWQTVRSMNLKVRDLTILANSVSAALGFSSAGESAPSSD